MSFLEGFAIGLGMVIFVGPVFFLLLNSSLQWGTRAGLAVALGIIVSDVICVVLCWYGLSSFISVEENRFWIGMVGSLILLILGVHYLIKDPKMTTQLSLNSRGFQTFFIKGFSVNFFNPFVFAVWIGVLQYGKSKYLDKPALVIFLVAVLTGIFTTDFIKVVLSKKVKRFISVKRLSIFFKITGVILVLFSIRLVYLVW